MRMYSQVQQFIDTGVPCMHIAVGISLMFSAETSYLQETQR